MVGSNLQIWMSPWLREQGDIAANAIQMDRAAEGRELLGPYSKHGFHHPGPALYYLHAAADRAVWFLPTPMGRRLVAQMSLNLAALASAAWLLRRAGLSAPAAIFGFFLLVAPTVFLAGGDVSQLASTWGPLAVVAPMVLYVAAAARLAEGDLIAAPFAVAAATVAWHTHLATILPLISIAAVTAAWLRWQAPPVVPPPSSRGARVLVGITACLVLAGIVPVVSEEFSGNPGNLTLIARFLRDTPPVTHPWAEVAGKLGTALTDPLVVLFPAAATRLGTPAVAVGLGAFLLALSVVQFRRSPRPWRLVILLTWIAVVAAVLTSRRIHEVLRPYVFYYLYGMAGLLHVIAFRALLDLWPATHRAPQRFRQWLSAGIGLGLAVPWLLCHRVPPPEAKDDISAALAGLEVGNAPSVHLSLGSGIRDGELWHLVPTCALQLRRAGVAVTVDERFVVVCGEEMRVEPASPPSTTIVFTREDSVPGQVRRFETTGWSAVAIPMNR